MNTHEALIELAISRTKEAISDLTFLLAQNRDDYNLLCGAKTLLEDAVSRLNGAVKG